MIETIGDLIEELKKYPQDALIFDMYSDRFEEIKYCNEIYLGDPANPYVEITEGYKLE